MLMRLSLLLLLVFCTPLIHAQAVNENSASDKPSSVDQQIEALKQQVLELNRDLFILEEELLYPAETQLAVYLSMDIGKFFQLDSVKLTVDDDVVTHYLYTERQQDALARGGVQRLYMGNIKQGEHELVAVFVGRGPNGRDFRRGATLKFVKQDSSKQIELVINDDTSTQQPEFVVKEW